MITYSKSKELSKIEFLRTKGKFNEALQKLNKLESKEDLTPQDKLSCYIIRSFILCALGNYDKAFKFAEQAFQESKELHETLYLIDAYYLKSLLLYFDSSSDKALDLIYKCEEFLKSISQVPPIELKKREVLLAFLKGYIYMDNGELNKAIKNLTYALKLSKEIGIQQGICASYGHLVVYYLESKGNWDKALKYNEKSFNLAKKIDYKPLISLSLLRFGVIYETKGELDLALKYIKESLSLAKKMDQKPVITGCFNALGRIYQEKGEFDQALKYCEECLEIKEEMGHRQGKFGILDTLFYLCYIKKDLEKAQYYFNQMSQIKQQGISSMQETFFQLDKALLMKMSSETDKFARSKEMLEEIVRKMIGQEITIRALLSLCDLMLIELRNTDNLNFLDEIQSYILQIQSIAKNLNSYWLIAETYSLQAQLRLIIFEFNEAQNLLIKAMDIAQKYGQSRIVKRLINEQNDLTNNLNKWERLKTSGAKLSERMDLTHIEEKIGILLQKRRYLQLIGN